MTQLGFKRQYGLVPLLNQWWDDVQHLQNLSNISREICEDFGFQYRNDANTSKTTLQDARIPGASASDRVGLVIIGDKDLSHDGGNSGNLGLTLEISNRRLPIKTTTLAVLQSNEPPSSAVTWTCHHDVQHISVKVHSTLSSVYLNKKSTSHVPINSIQIT
ncbi:uncharacterized protein KD926_011677 [Aspergillus affinis]|uniref:uncharacterized protein n=1 Tax=Aspergillus affinis TaxID=1070780 RepID=UPI0022FEAB3B|nr:uncharacterized protein KD926_011677 [Aspergillus affinis]KAI9044707.1 hypothetical protein KD926_011677 [Aspergillus affinis]